MTLPPRHTAALVAGLAMMAGGAGAQEKDVPLPPPRDPTIAAAPKEGPPANPAVPLPPERPADLVKPADVAKPATAAEPTSGDIDKEKALCQSILAEGTLVAEVLPPIRGEGECGIDAPVSLQAVVLKNKSVVRLTPPVQVRCDLASSFAQWVRDDVVDALAAQTLTLAGIAGVDGYTCRSRNHVAGAKLSEHARGNAIDVEALVVSPARRIALTSADALPFASALRTSACTRFSTVLGPGSDAYHDTHVHLDLEHRASHTALCQWRIP